MNPNQNRSVSSVRSEVFDPRFLANIASLYAKLALLFPSAFGSTKSPNMSPTKASAVSKRCHT